MANGDLLPRDLFRFPLISIPTLVDDVVDLLPTANILNGLSVSDDDKSIYVEAAVPGIDPKDVDVTFTKGILTIKGEKKEEEKGKTYRRKATQSFFYRVHPEDVDPKSEPEATYENGIMTVKFAKIPEAKPKRIAVKTAKEKVK